MKRLIAEPALRSTAGLLVLPCALALLAIGLAGSAYNLQIFSNALLVAALALGLNFVVGLAGQTSFAQAAFYGVGAYTTANLTARLELPFIVALLASIVTGVLAGSLLGLASRRLTGAYFSIVTIGMQLIFLVILNKWTPVTGGSGGIYGVPVVSFGTLEIKSGMEMYITAAIWLVIVTLFSMRARRSKLGWELRMIRNDEEAASAAGIPTARRKLVAFMLATGIAGGTGAFYAGFTGIVSPTAFNLNISATLLVIVFVAGRGSIPSVVISAIVLTVLPEYLRFLSDYRILLFGAIMVLVALFLPDGISSLVDRLRRRIRHRLTREVRS